MNISKKVRSIIVLFTSIFLIFGCTSKTASVNNNYDDWKKQGYKIAYTNGYKENEDTVQMYKNEKKSNPIFTYEQKSNNFFYCDSVIKNIVLNIDTENFDGGNVSDKVETKIKESLRNNLKELNTDKNTIKKFLKKITIDKKMQKKYVDGYKNELSPVKSKNNSIYGAGGIDNPNFTPKGSGNALMNFMKSIENQGVMLVNPTRIGNWVNVDLKINGVETDSTAIKYFVENQKVYIAKVVIKSIDLFNSEETKYVYNTICKAININLSDEEISNCLNKLSKDGSSIIYNDTLFERNDTYCTLTVAY